MRKFARIVVVDDDASIRLSFATLLQKEGYDVTTADNSHDAIALLEEATFDLLLCALTMPGVDGTKIIRTAQARDPEMTIVVLIGHSARERALTSLPHGIFDYLLKTTAADVALQRIQAGLEHRHRKQHQKQIFQRLLDVALELGVELEADTGTARIGLANSHHQDTISIGSLRIDALHQEVELAGRTAELTPTEVRVLTCLAQHAGSMLSYNQLAQSVLGCETSPAQAAELIKPHLYHLRQKLERDPVHPRYLLNVRGNGYMFAPDQPDEVDYDASRQELAELAAHQV